MGEVALARNPLCIKVAPEIDVILRSLPNRSEYIRDAVIKQLRLDGLLESAN